MQRSHNAARAVRHRSVAPITVRVDDPEGVAQRCWDAGLTIRVRQDRAGRTLLSVIDSRGSRVDLLPPIDLPASLPEPGKELQQ